MAAARGALDAARADRAQARLLGEREHSTRAPLSWHADADAVAGGDAGADADADCDGGDGDTGAGANAGTVRDEISRAVTRQFDHSFPAGRRA